MISTANDLRNLAGLGGLPNSATCRAPLATSGSPLRQALDTFVSVKSASLQGIVSGPVFQQSGQALGALINSTPVLQYGVPLAGLLAVGSLGIHGVVDTVEGLASGRDGQALSGALRGGAAAGFVMATRNPVAGVAGLAMLGADHGLRRAACLRASGARTAVAMVTAGAGCVAGGIGVPLATTWAGYQVAGPIGGAVGMVAGALIGPSLGAEVGARMAL